MGIYDSKGDLRQYDAGEVSVSDASELADLADRTIGWVISFEVRGEIDLVAEKIENDIVTSYPNVKGGKK